MMQQQPGRQELDRLARQDPTQLVQEAMLRMARDMREKGHVNESLDMYSRLMEDYPGSDAATAAANGLVELAVYLEQNGMPHQALFVYQRLQELQGAGG